MVRSGRAALSRAGFVVLAGPCGDPDVLFGDGEIILNFQRRTECPVYGWGLLVPAGPGLGLWLGGTAEAVPFPFAPRRTLWEGRAVGEEQVPRFARNDNI